MYVHWREIHCACTYTWGLLNERYSVLVFEMTTKRLRCEEEEEQILSPTKRMRSEAAQEENEEEEEIDRVVSGSQDIDTSRSRMCLRSDTSDLIKLVGFGRLL